MKNKWLMPLLRRRIIVALLILLQILFMVYLLVSGSYLSSALSAVFVGISFLVALLVSSSEGENAYKLTWCIVILSFPLVGGLLYLAFSEHFLRYSLNKKAKLAEAKTHPLRYAVSGTAAGGAHYPGTVRYLTDFLGFPAYTDTQTTFLGSGREMHERLLEELEKAEKYIFMEYFIIEHGEMWDSILEVLLRRVKAGVRVRVIFDDMGCFLRLPARYPGLLRKYGIEVAKFNPFVPFFSVEQNNRDHRKITVIDGKVAFTGGINLADEYIEKGSRFGRWADTAVMLTGGAAWSFALMFLQSWRMISKTDEDLFAYLPVGVSREQAEQSIQSAKKERTAEAAVAKRELLPVALPYADSPLDSENVGEQVYLQIIQNARRYVYITTPYLIIDDKLISALTLAAKSGVDVRIITPHKWDKKIVHKTTRTYYHTLTQSGVRVFEYTPGFMHAKMVVADDEIAVVGSVNFDFRSFFLHFECGVYLYGSETVHAVRHAFLDYEEVSEEIQPAPPRKNIFSRLYRAVLRLLAPLM